MNAITRIFIVAMMACASIEAPAAPVFADGDIIFHTSRSAQSVAVQRATGSRYSHMGLIFFRAGKPFVYEAVGPVKFTPLASWTARGQNGHYVVKRLANASTVLTADAVRRLRSAAAAFEGRPYDLTFEWSDDRMCCSEIVWKLFDRVLGVQLGVLQKIRDFELADPAVRATMRQRYGDRIPLDESAISPGTIFASRALVTVATE